MLPVGYRSAHSLIVCSSAVARVGQSSKIATLDPGRSGWTRRRFLASSNACCSKGLWPFRWPLTMPALDLREEWAAGVVSDLENKHAVGEPGASRNC